MSTSRCWQNLFTRQISIQIIVSITYEGKKNVGIKYQKESKGIHWLFTNYIIDYNPKKKKNVNSLWWYDNRYGS